MTVAKIMQSKGSSDVTTIAPDVAVAEAARVLSERRIGCLVVSKDGKSPLGILSERDIVREIGRQGPGCLDQKVEKMMTAKLVTCTREDRADDVLKKMTEGRFRHIPVLEGAHMVGLISIGDVVKMRLSELSMERDALEGMIKGF
jgi:CBS domain-containing protein